MRDLRTRDPIVFPQSKVRQTVTLRDWEESIERRNQTYASALVKAMNTGLSPDEARAVARKAFLDDFEHRPEVEFTVTLGGIEVAPTVRRGRRAA